MKAKKSIWTSITGGLTSAAPILFACCKSGACVGVCASPIASLFGIFEGKKHQGISKSITFRMFFEDPPKNVSKM